MYEIRESKIQELPIIYEIGTEEYTKPFLSTKSMDDCTREFMDKNTTYLSIVDTANTILGYFILFQNESNNSIQLKRILISKDSLGIGQDVLRSLEKYCINIMGIKHIWLDVYANNYRAIHIYKKLDYQLFNTLIHDNRKVLYYDKFL